MGCCVAVPQDRVVVVEKFGKFNRIAQPGCSCLPLPIIWRASGSVTTRIQQLTIPVKTKTKDNVFVTITVVVQFVVLEGQENQYNAFYKLMDPNHQITAYVEDGVRAEVPTIDLDVVFLEKGQIAESIHQSLNKKMSFYGYKIIGTLVTDVAPDERVKYEMNEINVSRRIAVSVAEKAESDKATKIKAAEAQAEATYLSGEGIARQRKAIVDGLRDSVDLLAKDVAAANHQEVMELMLVTQYFDTLRDLTSSKGSKVIFSAKRPRGRLMSSSTKLPTKRGPSATTGVAVATSSNTRNSMYATDLLRDSLATTEDSR